MTEPRETVLVTGGAGYVGSVTTDALLRSGRRVRVLDNLTFGGGGVLPFLSHPHYQFTKGDIRNEGDLRGAVDGADSVVHLAAVVGDPACRMEPQKAVEVNRLGSELLAEVSARAGVKRFVFTSTCSNYGRMPDPEGFVDEDSPLNPVSHYAELKVGFENYLFALGGGSMIPTVLRFATAYGLSARPRFDLTVNEFTRELYLRRKLEVFGNQFWRPYCHTRDLAAAVVAVLDASQAAVAFEAYNVGSTAENYRKRDIVENILRALPDRAHLVSRVHRDEDPRDYRVRFEKIACRLGYSTTMTVPAGVAEIVGALELGIISDPDSERYRNA